MSVENFSLLDWEGDDILNNPTELDLRVDRILEQIPSGDEDSVSSRLVIAEETDNKSTPSLFSVDTPSTSSMDQSPPTQMVPGPLPLQAVQNIPAAPTNNSTLQNEVPENKQLLQRRRIAHVSTRQIPWESPLDKMKRYKSRQERYAVLRESYLERYKKMKNMLRLQKAGPEALPPWEETIKLFEQVKSHKL